MKVNLEIVGPSVFIRSSWDEIKKDKVLLFAFISDTSCANVVYWRGMSVSLHFPFFRFINSFVDAGTFDLDE